MTFYLFFKAKNHFIVFLLSIYHNILKINIQNYLKFTICADTKYIILQIFQRIYHKFSLLNRENSMLEVRSFLSDIEYMNNNCLFLNILDNYNCRNHCFSCNYHTVSPYFISLLKFIIYYRVFCLYCSIH